MRRITNNVTAHNPELHSAQSIDRELGRPRIGAGLCRCVWRWRHLVYDPGKSYRVEVLVDRRLRQEVQPLVSGLDFTKLSWSNVHQGAQLGAIATCKGAKEVEKLLSSPRPKPIELVLQEVEARKQRGTILGAPIVSFVDGLSQLATECRQHGATGQCVSELVKEPELCLGRQLPMTTSHLGKHRPAKPKLGRNLGVIQGHAVPEQVQLGNPVDVEEEHEWAMNRIV